MKDKQEFIENYLTNDMQIWLTSDLEKFKLDLPIKTLQSFLDNLNSYELVRNYLLKTKQKEVIKHLNLDKKIWKKLNFEDRCAFLAHNKQLLTKIFVETEFNSEDANAILSLSINHSLNEFWYVIIHTPAQIFLLRSWVIKELIEEK